MCTIVCGTFRTVEDSAKHLFPAAPDSVVERVMKEFHEFGKAAVAAKMVNYKEPHHAGIDDERAYQELLWLDDRFKSYGIPPRGCEEVSDLRVA